VITPSTGARPILVVEDEPVLRSSMVRGLSKLAGVEVFDAGSVEEAAKIIDAVRPRLVISDLDLPLASGVELVAILDRKGLRVPIVFVSAFLGRYAARIPTRGHIEVREKPIPLEALRELVRKKLEMPEHEDAPFAAADYVQLACMSRRSVAVCFERDGREHGRVVIHEGEIWRAEDASGVGPEALRRLLFGGGGPQVRCEALRGPLEARNVAGSWQILLLDAARAADEERQAAPPPPKKPEIDGAALVDDAVEALLARDYDRAAALFERAATVVPDDPRVVVNLPRLRALGYGGGHAR
jgi:CheY-like chemotaxis protein